MKIYFLFFSRNQSLTSKFVASKVATNGNAGGDKFIRIRLLPAILLPGNSNARGDSAYEKGGDAHRNFWIKPLKETDLGVAQAFFDP